MKEVAWKKIFTLWWRWSILMVLIHTIILGLINHWDFGANPIIQNAQHWYFDFQYPILNIVGLQFFLFSITFPIILLNENNNWHGTLLTLYIIFGFISSIICFQFILIVLITLFVLFLIALVLKGVVLGSKWLFTREKIRIFFLAEDIED